MTTSKFSWNMRNKFGCQKSSTGLQVVPQHATTCHHMTCHNRNVLHFRSCQLEFWTRNTWMEWVIRQLCFGLLCQQTSRCDKNSWYSVPRSPKRFLPRVWCGPIIYWPLVVSFRTFYLICLVTPDKPTSSSCFRSRQDTSRSPCFGVTQLSNKLFWCMLMLRGWVFLADFGKRPNTWV